MFALQAATNGTAQTASNGTVAQTAANGTQTYSNAAVVPAVTSVALLSNYLTVDAFNSSEKARVMVLMLAHSTSSCPAMLYSAFSVKKNAQQLCMQCMSMHLRRNSVHVTQVTAVMPC